MNDSKRLEAVHRQLDVVKYLPRVVPGYILFEENELDEFHFGTVEGSLDYRIEPHEETEALNFYGMGMMKWSRLVGEVGR